MSHITRIQTKFINKDLLIQAIQDLGLSAEEGYFTIQTHGSECVEATIRIKRPLSSDIGFHDNGKSYEIVADWWGVRGLNKTKFSDKLKQRYAYHTACSQLASQGFSLVEEESDNQGTIRLILRRLE